MKHKTYNMTGVLLSANLPLDKQDSRTECNSIYKCYINDFQQYCLYITLNIKILLL